MSISWTWNLLILEKSRFQIIYRLSVIHSHNMTWLWQTTRSLKFFNLALYKWKLFHAKTWPWESYSKTQGNFACCLFIFFVVVVSVVANCFKKTRHQQENNNQFNIYVKTIRLRLTTISIVYHTLLSSSSSLVNKPCHTNFTNLNYSFVLYRNS